MKKRTLSLILALVMCLSLAAPALASSIQPRSPTCAECGGDTIYDYRLYKQYPCEQCGKDGCGPRYLGWECTSCNSFSPTSLMGYACG